MAIVNSMWLKGSKKRLGGTVIYQAMGQTRQRELAAEVSNPRTQSQMSQRVKWANLVNFYRANSSWMKYAFESKKVSQSEYNKFMSLNVSNSTIYLTKQEASAGACVCYPYIITQGSLPSIEVNSFDDEYQSNIYLSEATVMDEGVSVARLSQDLLSSNPGLREGDQISFIRVTQQANGDFGIPFVIVRRYEMLLDLQEERAWNEFLPSDLVGPSTSGSRDLIAVFSNEASGGFAFVLSRTIAGKTFVSSQRLTMVNNDSYIQQYSSSTQLNKAIRSYGENEDAFLSTTSAQVNTQASVFNSILSAVYGANRFNAGERWENFIAQGSGTITLVFGTPVTTAPTSVRLTTNLRTLNLSNITIENGNVYANIPSGTTDEEDEVVWNIKAVIDGNIYQIAFETQSSDIPGGLE